jgi:hypothetical protein
MLTEFNRFSQIVAGQASSMSRQAIMKHVQLHGDFMSLEDFEDLLSNLTTFDARSAIVFVQFAYKFRSKAVQSRVCLPHVPNITTKSMI